jgi:DNA ligase (NAD+)
MSDRAEAGRRVTELRGEIQRLDDRYRAGDPEVTDQQFDAMMQELIELEERHPALLTPDSPSQRVGGEPVEGFEQVEHDPVMLSLDNTYSTDDLRKWVERLRRLEPEADFVFVAELKIDGVSISLVYEDRLLVRAATRGNGRIGDDVTQNVRTIRTIPLRLRDEAPPRLTVRGEIFMPLEAFRQLNKNREAAGEALYVNPRNTTAGTIRLLDSRVVAERQLAALVYDLHSDLVPGSPMKNRHSQNLENLDSWGFTINSGWRVCSSIDEVIDFIDEWNTARHDLPFETDGVVVKIDDLELRVRLGSTSKAPRWAVAFKFDPEQAETLVHGIGVHVGRTGTLTPVAELEPVFVGGTTVHRATLHNYEDLARKDVRIGDTVRIEKGGEIIPKVVEVRLDRRPKKSVPYEVPSACPVCDHPVVKFEGEVAVRCVNPACPEVVKESIRHFVSRNAMNIEGLGGRLIGQLLSQGLLVDYTSLYSLRASDLEELEGWGEISARKLEAELEKSKRTELSSVLFALGIRFVGQRAARLLADRFGSLEAISEATTEALVDVDGIGEKVAASLRSFFADGENQTRIGKLQTAGVLLDRVQRRTVDESHALAGKRFVITGTLAGRSRSQAKKELEAVGALVGGSVSSRTDYLLAGDKAGSKLKKAEDLGIEILDEEAYLSLLG